MQQNYNIEVINFTPAANSTLLPYFNTKLNKLAENPKVKEIKTAKLILHYQRPPNTSADYLYSQHINQPGSARLFYHICEVLVAIESKDNITVDCRISYYDEVYFTEAIDDVIDEALSRCFRYS